MICSSDLRRFSPIVGPLPPFCDHASSAFVAANDKHSVHTTPNKLPGNREILNVVQKVNTFLLVNTPHDK